MRLERSFQSSCANKRAVVSQPARSVQLFKSVCGAGLADQERGERVTVLSPIGGIRSSLIVLEGEAAGGTAACATDFADE